MKRTSITFLIILSAMVSVAQTTFPEYEAQVYRKGKSVLPYRIMYPKNFDKSKKYPLVFFLHGSGERGSDNSKQLAYGASLFASDSIRSEYPAIVVFPQCAEGDYWANVKLNQDDKGFRSYLFHPEAKPTPAMKALLGLVRQLSYKSYVDKNRIYVGGLSMGGIGTYELLYRKPNTFAAAIVICGGSDPKVVDKYAQKVPLWIFHGEADNIVLTEYSREMYNAILGLGGKVKLTTYPGVGHNSWENALKEPDLLHWLFSNSKK